MSIEILFLPIIGALIGYVTNYIAIKMLFLPKNPYYLFGFKIPFTPGLIPKKRKNIIDKISYTISNKIVDKKEIIKHIYKKKNRLFLYEFADKILNTILARKLSSFNIDYKKLENLIRKILDENLSSIVKEKFKIDFKYIVHSVFDLVDKDKDVISYLNKSQIDNIKSASDEFSKTALYKLSNDFDSQEMRTLINNTIKSAMDKYADDSNILLASLISMASPLFEDNKKITDAIIFEIKNILINPVVIDKTKNAIFISIKEKILDKKPEELLKILDIKNMEQLQALIADKAELLLKKTDIKGKIIDNIINTLDNYKISFEITAYIRLLLNKYTMFDLINAFKPDIYKKLPSIIVNNLIYVVKKESDKIFNFDIEKLAREKLSALDISEVEDVVLNISKDQFRYINFFGAVLGFLIGLLEILLSLSPNILI